jgi:Flp pilus assembly protein TadG
MRSSKSSDSGQAAVELVLITPVVALLLLAAVQVAVVISDQLALESLARDRARAVALGDTTRESPNGRYSFTSTTHNGVVTIAATYRAPTDIPLVGRLVSDVELTADATMLIEPTT